MSKKVSDWPVQFYGAAESRDAPGPPVGRLAPTPSPAEACPRASRWFLRNIKTATKSLSVSFRALSHSPFLRTALRKSF